jgi:hypothetical protein
MKADINGRLGFPEEILVTNKRPDIVVWSKSKKAVIMIELTIACEERIESAFERKRSKYEELLRDCVTAGWKAWLFPIEVGCRGFVGKSVWRMCSEIGIVGKVRSQLIKDCGEAAEKA